MTAKTISQLKSELLADVPDGQPAVLTAASLRSFLTDLLDSLGSSGTPFALFGGTFNISGGGASIDVSGNISGNTVSMGEFITTVSGSLSGTVGSFGTLSVIITASGTFTLVLPPASLVPGAWLFLKSTTSFPVNSGSTNILPLGSAAATSVIFTSNATSKWVALQSNGTNWVTMMGSAGQ